MMLGVWCSEFISMFPIWFGFWIFDRANLSLLALVGTWDSGIEYAENKIRCPLSPVAQAGKRQKSEAKNKK